ncbi:MAG: flagellar hook-length control protein FliK [Parvularculaceae bacterium]|nr:flagellar hook-length control protein FliK [Parvularculaceae bacterium]
MMIDSVPSPLDPPAAARRRPEAAGAYSYAQAAAALERGAGRSLQAHGARPEGATLTPGATSRSAADRDRSTAKAAATTGAGDDRSSPPPAQARNTAAPAAPAPVTPLASPAESPGRSAAPPPSPASILTVAPTVNAVAAKPLAPAGAASGETARIHNAPKLAAPSAPGPVRSPDDLAQLIARRLDEGASEFEFRLDPPELGRIEGRLTLGDDGAARLTVAFDNQAAYDLFARDEAALRLAFANAGLDFGRGALALVLEERRSAQAPAPKETAQPYIALVAARALDVRV